MSLLDDLGDTPARILKMFGDIALDDNVGINHRIRAGTVYLSKTIPSLSAVQHQHMGAIAINFVDPIAAARQRIETERVNREIREKLGNTILPLGPGEEIIEGNAE